MDMEQDISPELAQRIDALATQTSTTRARIIEDALNGQSLAWQEEYARRVQDGAEAADRGDFATDAEMDAVFDKYRPI